MDRAAGPAVERGRVVLWDGQTFNRLVALPTGTGEVRCVNFSSDGRLLAAGSYAAPTFVWDIEAVRGTLRSLRLDW